jgi:hypothetical protein
MYTFLLNVKPFSTAKKKFALGFSTDGYGVSLRFEKERPADAPPKKAAYRKLTPAQRKEREMEEGFDKLPTKEELKKFTHFIGIDPGQTFAISAFAGEMIPNPKPEHIVKPKTERRKVKPPKKQRKVKKNLSEEEKKKIIDEKIAKDLEITERRKNERLKKQENQRKKWKSKGKAKWQARRKAKKECRGRAKQKRKGKKGDRKEGKTRRKHDKTKPKYKAHKSDLMLPITNAGDDDGAAKRGSDADSNAPIDQGGGDENKGHMKSRVLQFSTRRFRHISKTTRFTQWEKHLRAREKKYADLVKDLPTLKVDNPQMFSTNFREIAARSRELFVYTKEKPFRKWRFKRFIYEQVALHEVYKEIIPEAHRNPKSTDKEIIQEAHQQPKSTALVGFGDWSIQDGLRGNPKAPVKKIRKALRMKGVTVVRIDEYRTSKTCSHCVSIPENHEEMDYEKFIVKNLKHLQIRRNRTTRLREEGVFETHAVICCPNCMIPWQRDVNASRNIRLLLDCLVQGKERPLAMRRGGPKKDTNKKRSKKSEKTSSDNGPGHDAKRAKLAH